MERSEAITKLQQLVGKELHDLANQYEVTIYRNGRVNKGWVDMFLNAICNCP